MSSEIYITSSDNERIRKILNKERQKKTDKTFEKLERELNRAVIVNSENISHDVVTMNSKALLNVYDEDIEVSLVYPEDADIEAMKLSVFSPIGAAILGYKEGNTVDWEVPSGTSRIHIKKILYQPEAAGDFNS